MELQVGLNGHHLRKTLNIMFPSAYITLYHRPPNSACSPLLLRAVPIRDNNGEQAQPAFEVSSEPSSRSSISYLCQFLESSLIEHQAKSTGLCPVRRAIYDQCFGKFSSRASTLSRPVHRLTSKLALLFRRAHPFHHHRLHRAGLVTVPCKE